MYTIDYETVISLPQNCLVTPYTESIEYPLPCESISIDHESYMDFSPCSVAVSIVKSLSNVHSISDPPPHDESNRPHEFPFGIVMIVFFLSCVRKSRTSTSPTNVSKLHDDVVLFNSWIKSEYDTYSFQSRDLIVGKDPDTLNPLAIIAFFRV